MKFSLSLVGSGLLGTTVTVVKGFKVDLAGRGGAAILEEAGAIENA